MKSYRIAIGVLLWCIAANVFAQSSIQGTITDGKEKLPGATVLLLNRDSIVVKGAVTNEAGTFIFEGIARGKYMISSSMIGYTTSFSVPVEFNGGSSVLPDIILQEALTSLGEVVIEAEKPLFEHKIDRLVVNVQSSISSSGNSTLEVLQKSPGVVVNRQNNTIAMNAKSGVRIMINGKILQLPLDVVIQMLDGMPASNVEKIELMTNPSAAYDAEGNAGIIHIITKVNEDFGTNGSFGLTLGARWAEALGGNFNINHRRKNFACFVDYALLVNHNLHEMKMERRFVTDGFTQVTSDDSHRENRTTQQNVNGGIEFNIRDNTRVNVLFTGYSRKWRLNAIAADIHRAAADSTVVSSMDVRESNIWQSATASVGIEQKITAKSHVTLNFDYLYYHNDNPSTYDIDIFSEEDGQHADEKIQLGKTTPIHFLVGKADYQHRFSSVVVVEAGAKAVTSTLDNNVLVQRDVKDSWTTDPILTSYSTLRENVGAAYVTGKWHVQEDLQIHGGIRVEHTNTVISTPVDGDLVRRNYTYFFPGFSIQKNIGPETDLGFSYSRRITRPTYNDIAPFVFFWSPNTFSAGNTSLYPAIADAVSASYHVKQWSTTVHFTHTHNEISFFQPDVDLQSNDLVYRSQNLIYLNTLGFTSTYSHGVTRWWDLQANMTTQYQSGKTQHLEKNVMLFQYGINFQMTNQFKLPKRLSIEVSCTYQSRSLYGASSFLPFGSLNAGIQKKVGEKGTFRLAIDDAFNTNNWRLKSYSPENNLDAYFDYHWHNRFVRLTYTHVFGNNKLRAVKFKSGSDEERDRIGN